MLVCVCSCLVFCVCILVITKYQEEEYENTKFPLLGDCFSARSRLRLGFFFISLFNIVHIRSGILVVRSYCGQECGERRSGKPETYDSRDALKILTTSLTNFGDSVVGGK